MAKMGIAVTVTGLDKVLKKLAMTEHQLMGVAAKQLHRSGEEVMGLSKEKYVPVDKGILRSSGHVELPEDTGSEITVQMGYGGAASSYAAKVHENPRAGKTAHGAQVGEWKYLETPLKELTPQIEKDLFMAIDNLIDRG